MTQQRGLTSQPWNPFSGWLGQLGIPKEDREPFSRYQTEGGGLGYNAWIREGKPPPPVRITQRTRDILARTGGVPPGVEIPEAALPTVPERVEVVRAQRALTQPPPEPKLQPLQFRTFEEAEKAAPEGWVVDRDEFGLFTIKRMPTKQRLPGNIYKSFKEANEAAPEGFRAVPVGDGWGIERIPEVSPERGITPFQERQFDVQEQQFGQQQQQFEAQLQFQQEQAQMQADLQREQERARLSANPMSWLQFAAFTGEAPLVQPWMVPLGAQQQGLQVGQQIPGFEGGTAPDFTQLPQLTTPSAQLQARWGPTAQAQFLGFRQARTGATPQETQFRLGAGRAPTGRFGGFSRFR